jgi:Family of unknown function (DUF5670)
MDFGLVAALAMLVIWGVGTFVYQAPGWIHLLLTAGVFLLIHRIVARATPNGTTPSRPDQR